MTIRQSQIRINLYVYLLSTLSSEETVKLGEMDSRAFEIGINMEEKAALTAILEGLIGGHGISAVLSALADATASRFQRRNRAKGDAMNEREMQIHIEDLQSQNSELSGALKAIVEDWITLDEGPNWRSVTCGLDKWETAKAETLYPRG